MSWSFCLSPPGSLPPWVPATMGPWTAAVLASGERLLFLLLHMHHLNRARDILGRCRGRHPTPTEDPALLSQTR